MSSAAQAGCAFSAAATALFTSAASPAGTSPIFSSLAGLTEFDPLVGLARRPARRRSASGPSFGRVRSWSVLSDCVARYYVARMSKATSRRWGNGRWPLWQQAARSLRRYVVARSLAACLRVAVVPQTDGVKSTESGLRLLQASSRDDHGPLCRNRRVIGKLERVRCGCERARSFARPRLPASRRR